MIKAISRYSLLACAGGVFGLMAHAGAAPASVESKAGPVKVESLAKLDNPWGMTFLPDGRLLITEKPGRLRVFADGKLSEPIGGVPEVAYRQQGGLLDVQIDPKFADNKLVYLSYAEPAQQQPAGAKDEIDPRLGTFFKADDPQLKGGAVARARLDGNNLVDLKVIWRQVPKTIGRGHFGGPMVFAPDGKLFILSGERQRFEPAQDPKSNLGKVVRINPDGSLPDDNPFAKQAGGLPDVYTIGNRNPLGGAIEPNSGKLWIHEMGPKGGDELIMVEPGKNYGWPVVAEKAAHYNDAPIPGHDTKSDFTPPALAWTPVISPSGMIFYQGSMFPAWKGSALIGGLSSKALVRVTVDGPKAVEAERLDMTLRVRDVVEAPDGAVLLLSDGKDAELLRLTPGGAKGE
ncbi:MAG: PQQ-dependent oxidoreductase, gdhB family [uncultured Phycisphaerae bacterium]|uniref:PQQ-dependent oxidoreductase, gdhB family n=1 Tax=uncultured Phycisphaerae bacterium TaxID=904963 RepID=A0A6J4Q4Y8_9BACT|nr:MAG: PQQ-dependent oxidoreductase, gdhB family [uncultured Phycisphaerae bacterium]